MALQFETAQRSEEANVETEAAKRFYDGLRSLSDIPNMAKNFGWCLAQLASQPDYEAQFRGMVEFLEAYQRSGLDTAWQAVKDVQGIPVDVVEQGGESVRPGRIVGVTGASQEQPTKFVGVICAELDHSGESFAHAIIDIEMPGVAQIARLKPES